MCWFCSTGILGRFYMTKEKQLISAILHSIQMWYKAAGASTAERPWCQSRWYTCLPNDDFFFYLIMLFCIRGDVRFKEKYKEILLILEYLERNFVLLMQAKLSVWFSETCLIPSKLIQEWKVISTDMVTGSVANLLQKCEIK